MLPAVDRDPARLFASPACELVTRADGTMIMKSRHALGAYPRSLGVYHDHWARVAPERPFLLQRDREGTWRGVTYAEARRKIRRVATSLLDYGLSPNRPVVILSDNSVEHALLMHASMYVGVPSVSVSSAYALQSSDHAKLRRIVSLVQPGLIYVLSGTRFARALQSIEDLHDAAIVCGEDAAAIRGAIEFAACNVEENPKTVSAAFEAVGPDTIAKLLFTSGSTDEPKAVINTQRMLVSNQEARAQLWPFLNETPPVLVDWLPWSHTFGGNHNLNLVLRFGGTLYIDAGRPAPQLFDATIANLREIAPTVYFNVPRGYDMLVRALVSDAALRASFFSRLQVLFYGGAALPQSLWEALIELSIRTLGHALPQVSGWGSTETGPLATDCHFQAKCCGVIGVPVPGCEIKLVPNANDKLEARVRGPNVTPGYFRRPELTASHFDAEGFYRIGDAVRLVDEAHPELGLMFDGRVAEDFKLDSGTWVNVGMLRLKALTALAPVAQDVVITGANRCAIGFLIFPNIAACRQLCAKLPQSVEIAAVLAHPSVCAHVAAGLAALRDAGNGSSTFATTALLMQEPASVDAGEITDKGYINQGAVLRRRSALVERLYQDDPAVIRCILSLP
jgi:feruloyl-CoA synthase